MNYFSCVSFLFAVWHQIEWKGSCIKRIVFFYSVTYQRVWSRANPASNQRNGRPNAAPVLSVTCPPSGKEDAPPVCPKTTSACPTTSVAQDTVIWTSNAQISQVNSSYSLTRVWETPIRRSNHGPLLLHLSLISRDTFESKCLCISKAIDFSAANGGFVSFNQNQMY